MLSMITGTRYATAVIEPVIDRLQTQQRDSDLVVRTILSQLHRLQSSRATPNADQPTPGQHGRAAVRAGAVGSATTRTGRRGSAAARAARVGVRPPPRH